MSLRTADIVRCQSSLHPSFARVGSPATVRGVGIDGDEPRKKDVIITGGENVSSIEVEDCLYQHAEVAEAAVIGVPHEKWGETVLACVVLRPGAAATAQDLIAHCRARLAHFKCPTTVELRDSLPRTATGKLQKFRLREPHWAGRDRGIN